MCKINTGPCSSRRRILSTDPLHRGSLSLTGLVLYLRTLLQRIKGCGTVGCMSVLSSDSGSPIQLGDLGCV